MKLAFFGYAWNKSLQPDAYMCEMVNALAQTGADVDLYLGSQISKEYGIYGLKDGLRAGDLGLFLAGQGYDAAISFNNSMLIPEVMGAVKGRVVTVIVDEPEHLFDYHRSGPFDVFREDVEIVAMSSRLERRIDEGVADARPRLHFMLPATHVDPHARALAAPVHPISWVASYVGDLNLDQYLELVGERADFHALTVKCLDLVARDGDLRQVKAEGGADAALIASLPWTFDYFQAQMQNILTNQGRVAVVERLARHGLALYGNAGWRKLLTHNTAVLAALRSGPSPTSHADLQRIYNHSRIAINLPQSHVARDAVQYRVIDVMASNALMITQRSQTSDLYRVFGKDCPVPTYADLDELEALCVRYLTHEDERRALVERCNQAVASGFTFADRAADFLRIARLEHPVAKPPGETRHIDLRRFAA
jgi:hypothetical protein